jgi:hypothetical protein
MTATAISQYGQGILENALQRNQLDAGGITTKATCFIDRNENRRFRVKKIEISIQFGKGL